MCRTWGAPAGKQNHRPLFRRRLGSAGPPRLRPPSQDAAWTLVCWLRVGQAQHQQPLGAEPTVRGRSAQATALRQQPGLGPPGRSPATTGGYAGEVPQNCPWLWACGGASGPQLGRTWRGCTLGHAGAVPGGGQIKLLAHGLGLVMGFEMPERKEGGVCLGSPAHPVPREGA